MIADTDLKVFLDADKVKCVPVDTAKLFYPNLNWEKIEQRFSWNMGEGNSGEIVMALADLNLCVVLHSKDMRLEDIAYEDVAHCVVCEAVLLPDDECYVDGRTGDALCDRHSAMDEGTDTYYKVTEEDILLDNAEEPVILNI